MTHHIDFATKWVVEDADPYESHRKVLNVTTHYGEGNLYLRKFYGDGFYIPPPFFILHYIYLQTIFARLFNIFTHLIKIVVCKIILITVNFSYLSHLTFSLITFAGTPAAKQLSGIGDVTTEPAAMTEPLPIVTPLNIMVPIPKHSNPNQILE